MKWSKKLYFSWREEPHPPSPFTIRLTINIHLTELREWAEVWWGVGQHLPIRLWRSQAKQGRVILHFVSLPTPLPLYPSLCALPNTLTSPTPSCPGIAYFLQIFCFATHALCDVLTCRKLSSLAKVKCDIIHFDDDDSDNVDEDDDDDDDNDGDDDHGHDDDDDDDDDGDGDGDDDDDDDNDDDGEDTNLVMMMVVLTMSTTVKEVTDDGNDDDKDDAFVLMMIIMNMENQILPFSFTDQEFLQTCRTQPITAQQAGETDQRGSGQHSSTSRAKPSLSRRGERPGL